MTISASTPAAASAPVAPARRAPVVLVPALEPALARRVLAEAALLGITADALLRNGPGLALPLWIAILAATFVSIAWSAGRRIGGEVAGWLLVAILAAATVAWRDAGLLEFAGFVTMLGALAMAALSFRDGHAGLRAERLRETVWAAVGVVRGVMGGFLPLAFREAMVPGEAPAVGRRVTPWLRAATLAIALVLLFGSLLRGADPIFASIVALPEIDLGTAISHVVLAGFFCWVTSGWTRGALDRRDATSAPVLTGARLGMPEITTALGALNLLFTAYLLTQLGWFFGGERFLRERTGLTAAAYARDGFFQMVWVVVLIIPVLMATRAMLPDDRALRRRHTRLALPLIVLLGLMIASAASRMQLYVHYYGLTTDRFYPMALMTWLGGVLGWFAWTELRGDGRRFVAGSIVSGLLVLLAVNVMSPDVLVARVDIARASGAGADPLRQLDLEYLATLSGEAVPLVVEATLAPPRALAATSARAEVQRQRCAAATHLLERWGPQSRRATRRLDESAWRTWNAGEATALGVVRERAPALRAVSHAACPATAPVPSPTSQTITVQ